MANLKYGEAVEKVAREGQTALSAQVADLARRGRANSLCSWSEPLSVLRADSRVSQGLFCSDAEKPSLPRST